MKWLLLVLAACDHHSISSCSDDLQGVYATPAGERWMLLDDEGGFVIVDRVQP